jgi:hypothetical protein
MIRSIIHKLHLLIKFQVKNKMIVGLDKLLIIMIKMIAHKHKDEALFQYYNKF